MSILRYSLVVFFICAVTAPGGGEPAGLDGAKVHPRGEVERLLREGHERRALEMLEEALRRNPKASWALKIRAKTSLDAMEFARAAADYTAMIRIDPQNVTALIGRAACFSKLRFERLAVKDLEAALTVNPHNSTAQERLPDALEALSYFESEVIENWRELLPAEIERFSDDIRADPTNQSAYRHRGSRWMQMKHYERAVEDFRRALTLESKYDFTAYFHLCLAEAFRHLGRNDEALVECGRALELDPQNAEPYAESSRLHASLGKWKRAAADAQKAVQLDPHTQEPYFVRANAESGLGRYAESVKDFTRVIRISPWEDAAHRQRGDAYARLGKTDLARRDYEASRILLDSAEYNRWRRDGEFVFEIARLRVEPGTVVPEAAIHWTAEYTRPAAVLRIEERWMLLKEGKPLFEKELTTTHEITPENSVHRRKSLITEAYPPGFYLLRLRARQVGAGRNDQDGFEERFAVFEVRR